MARRRIRRTKRSRIVYVREHHGLEALMKAPEHQVFFEVNDLAPPPSGTTSQQGTTNNDGRVIPSFNVEGWTCEQCGEVIDPRLCIWVNPDTQGIRHAHCRPFQVRQAKVVRPDGRLGNRNRLPGKQGATALELAEVALELEDIQAAKAYAQVALARSLHELMDWLHQREEERREAQDGD